MNSVYVIGIAGGSGSGKSTMLNILGCMDRPTSGHYILDGEHTEKLKRDALARIRSKKIGFVFQSYNLLNRTTAIENVELPLLYNSGVSASERRRRAIEALERVGLAERMNHLPNQLSGGQQQRVLLARALCATEKLLLLDEPVSGLDPVVTAEMYDAIRSLNREKGVTVIMVSHDIHNALHCCNKMLHMAQGKYFFGTKEEYKQIPEFKAMAGGCLNDK